MEIIAGRTQFQLNQETAVAIGKFDGIHIGHALLLQKIRAHKEKGLKTCVFTFDPPPAVFFGTSDGRELTGKAEKRALLEKMGVDVLIEFPMNRETAAIEPASFVNEILIGQMKMRYIAAGADLSFGAGGRGDALLLKKLSIAHGCEVEILDKVCLDGREVSSTYVREVLEQGDMEQVERLLGRPYSLIGEVVHGKKLGRTIGMPTLNLLPEEGKLMPPCGVYASTVCIKGKCYRGISNVGYKPTVASEHVLGVETYLFDFAGEIYGEEVEVSLLSFRRPERQFATLEELREQVTEDIAWAKSF